MNAAGSSAATPPPLPPRADRRRKVAPPTAPAPNLTSPIVQAAQDVEHARRLLDAPTTIKEDLDDADKEIHRMVREKEVTQLLIRMTDWVEELSLLLQQSYKKESELETTLALSQSNTPMVHVNNDLEESSKRAVTNGSAIREFAWRPWSKRDSRRTPDEETLNSNIEDTLTPLPKPQSPRNSGASFSGVSNPSQTAQGSPTPSRFFNFSSLTRTSSSLTVATLSLPEAVPPPKPTQREKELEQQLEKERTSLQKVISEKTALETELETLSQALFEQANKMVSNSNRKLAEIEEELRIAMEEREALKSTLRVIATHGKQNDGIHRLSVETAPPFNQGLLTTDPSTPRAHSASSSTTSSLIFELSPTTPHPNRAAHEIDAEESEEDDGVRSRSRPHTPSTHNIKEEIEEEPKSGAESKEIPDGSIYSQSESNSVPGHEEVKNEPLAAVESMEASNEDVGDAKQDSNQPSEHAPDLTSSVQPSLTKESGEEFVPAPDAVLDMTSMSPVSQYTLESISQNI